jgi:hypothetical protein
MQDRSWVGCVELSLEDGTLLGEATLRLRTSLISGAERWQGALRAPVTPQSKPWPADRPIRLHLVGGRMATAWLEPTVREVGPVLIQRARVRAESAEFEALLTGEPEAPTR